MKKKNILYLLLSFFALHLSAQTVLENTRKQLSSPDGNYVYTFYQKESSDHSKQMYYSLSFKGKTVVEESKLGLQIDNKLFESALGVPNDTIATWCANLNFSGEERTTVCKTWKPIYGERDLIRDNYNQLTLHFVKGKVENSEQTSGYDKRHFYLMDVVVRAYNEGLAFCYSFPEATNGLFIHITDEQTQFVMPENTQTYYEGWAQGAYSLLSLKNWSGESERPLTMKLANGLMVALCEARMVDYARTKFKLSAENTLQTSIYSSVDIITPYQTPWRVVMAGEKATDLIDNEAIIQNINPASKIEDTSWIKPGKMMRVAKLTQEDALKCVDFASERNLQYILLDAGWYGSEMKIESDATKVDATKNLNIPELVDYAAKKGIGVFLYVNQRALSKQLDDILPLYKKWGVKGIKFGFVQVGNQYWSTWLHEAVRKCAEYGILVDIHDEYRPTGYSRMYPNLLTQEGIRGNEEMPDATHNTILPFTRYLAGPADYTICYYNNRLKTTHAHQLAMSVVYYSPLQVLYWYDLPSAYHGEPEIEFFDKVKTTWNDTKIIAGEIGEFVTIARRSDKDWFLGTLGNTNERDVTTPVSFLDAKQNYVASIYTDDSSVNTKTKVRITRVVVDGKTVLHFHLKASGGCAVYFAPATKEDLKQYKKYKNEVL